MSARTLAGGFAAAALIALPAAAQAQEITSQEIADGLYLFQGAGSNVVAMADGRDLLIVDGGLDENSRALMSAIREATGGRNIDTLINTHWHPEQVGLNDEAGDDGATIIANDQTLMYLRNRVTSPLYDGHIEPLDEESWPNEVSRYGGELTFAGQTVVTGYLPAAHTNGD